MQKRQFLTLAASFAAGPALAVDPFKAASAAKTTPLILNLPSKQVQLSDADLAALPQATLANLTTPWYSTPQTFSGPTLRSIFEKYGISKTDQIRIVAHNDYTVDLPASDAWTFNVIVATHNNGKRMSLKEKGPFFTMYPLDNPKASAQQYFSRCVWQVISIDVK